MKQLIYHSTNLSNGFYKHFRPASFTALLGVLICFCVTTKGWTQCPTISIPAQTTVCAGQDINIVATINKRGTGDITYTWFFNAETKTSGTLPLSDSTLALSIPTISNSQYGTYSLEIRPSNTCGVKIAHTEVRALTKESIVFNPAKPILNCLTSSVMVDVTPKDPNYVYKWAGGQTTSNPVFTKAGQYGLTVTAGANCSVETSITIDTAKQPIAKAGAGLTLNDAGKGVGLTLTGCNQKFFLNSAGSKNDNSPNAGIDQLTYQWKKPDGSNLSPNPTVADNTMIGVYVLTVTHKESKCTDTAQVTVKAGTATLPKAVITPLASKEITCTTPKLTLDGSNSTPESPGVTLTTYAWARKAPGTNNYSSYNPSPALPDPKKREVTTPGTYQLIVTNSNGCSSLPDSTIITNNITPPVVTLNDQYNICKDIPYTLRPNPASNADTYSWKVNTGSNVPGSSLDIITTSLGNQTITLTGTRTANGCTATDNANVVVNPPPTLKIAGPDKIKEKLAANIIITSSGNVRWSLKETINIQLPGLDTGGVTKTFSPSFMLASSRATGYVAYNIFATANNCTVDSLREIEILPGASTFFPEIITPNGDGQNDTWNVVFPDDGDKAFHELFIFNRLGIQVYHNKDMLSPWNANGCPNGVYFYKIINTKDRAAKPYKGAITVLGRGE